MLRFCSKTGVKSSGLRSQLEASCISKYTEELQ